jgi:hypothetical protein
MSTSRPRLLAAPLLVALGCGGQDLPVAPPPPPPPPPAPWAAIAVPPPVGAEGTVAPIRDRKDVPLDGPRVDAKPGDWVIRNAGSVAVVAALDGRVIDFGPEGGRDELVALDPTVYLGLDSVHVEVASIEPAGDGGRALHVTRRVLEKPLWLHTFVSFSGAHLRVESAVTAASAKAAPLAITLGERVFWGNVPTWAEGQGFVQRGGTHMTDFLARESFGTSYALCSEGGRLMARFDSPDPPGFWEPATTGESALPVPLDKPSQRRAIVLSHGTRSLGHAAVSLPCA